MPNPCYPLLTVCFFLILFSIKNYMRQDGYAAIMIGTAGVPDNVNSSNFLLPWACRHVCLVPVKSRKWILWVKRVPKDKQYKKNRVRPTAFLQLYKIQRPFQYINISRHRSTKTRNALRPKSQINTLIHD